LEDLLVLVPEIAEADVVRLGELLVLELLVEELHPLLLRHQQQRIVAQLVDQLGVDQLVVEIGEGPGRLRVPVVAETGEADRALRRTARRTSGSAAAGRAGSSPRWCRSDRTRP